MENKKQTRMETCQELETAKSKGKKKGYERGRGARKFNQNKTEKSWEERM